MALLSAGIQQIGASQQKDRARSKITQNYWKRRAEMYGKDMSDLDLRDAYKQVEDQYNQGLSSSALGAISSAIGSGGFGDDSAAEANAWNNAATSGLQQQAADLAARGEQMSLDPNSYRLLSEPGQYSRPFVPTERDSQGGFDLEEDVYPLLSGRARRKHRFSL